MWADILVQMPPKLPMLVLMPAGDRLPANPVNKKSD